LTTSSQDYTREEILRKLKNFEKENGRPPRRRESGMQNVVYLARKHFGSWKHALNIAGLQTFNEWKRKQTFVGKLRVMLNCNPMTLTEIRLKLGKSSDFSTRIASALRQAKDIKSIGPKKSSVYFLVGQEKLAEAHFKNNPSNYQFHEEIFYHLRNPMTTSQLMETISGSNCVRNLKSKINRCLKQLLLARMIYQIKFVAGNRGAKKYKSGDLFGNLSCKRYFCRYDYPKQVAKLVIQNISLEKLNSSGFRCSLTHHLKRIVPDDVFLLIEKDIDNYING
jgi:hypothetical protein